MMMMSRWIFSLIESKHMFSTPPAPERQRTPEDSASVPRPTHTEALAISGERTGVAPELGGRGFLKVGLPKTANDHYIFFWHSGRALNSGRQKSEFKSPCLCFFALLLFFHFFLLLYCCCATSCTTPEYSGGLPVVPVCARQGHRHYSEAPALL